MKALAVGLLLFCTAVGIVGASIAIGLFAYEVVGLYHIVRTPTADQLYGCTYEQSAPNGECK